MKKKFHKVLHKDRPLDKGMKNPSAKLPEHKSVTHVLTKKPLNVTAHIDDSSHVVKKHLHSTIRRSEQKQVPRRLLKRYSIDSGGVPFEVTIFKVEGEFVPQYHVSLSSLGPTTAIILEKIREELIDKVNLGIVDISDSGKEDIVVTKFTKATEILIKKYFPGLDEKSQQYFISYLLKKSLGMGEVEFLMNDKDLEEIAINSSHEPIWVYHKQFGWLKTNITVDNEATIRHYATMIGRKANRQITILEPLMDANLGTGDRVNATLSPISSTGNTITIRKFAAKPWTICDFLRANTISPSAAALVWECIHYEMSAIIAGGTASGKTSMLNVVSNFFPPNQRIISIEDTREIRLPKFLHWIPLLTRLPNNEGKGGVNMLNLLVNSLRMRPDRIVVGEIRRKEEAEVLFESIHTGHSVYATVHANNTNETITRLTSPPIDVPRSMLPAVSLILVQYRNRRTGLRKTFELAEIKETGDANVLMRYDAHRDVLHKLANSISIRHNLELYTGLKFNTIHKEISEKEAVLKWIAKQNINTVDSVGRVMAEYYTNKDNLMKFVRSNKPFR